MLMNVTHGLGHVNTVTAARAAGLSYRQVHYWTYTGTLTAAHPGVGSGSRTWWSPEDVARLVVLGRLARLMPSQGIPRELVAAVWGHLPGRPSSWPMVLHVWRDGTVWHVSSRDPRRDHLALHVAA
jgi:hypothetical protein